MKRRRQRGNALVEFALAAGVLLPCFVGTFQFGFGFYSYNRLQTAVTDGARYAALRTYRSASANSITKVRRAVQNIVVYGTPSPGQTTPPVVRGLKPEHVSVTYVTSANGVPTSVAVGINNFSINAIFNSFTLRGKPVMTLPFLGRYAPTETEP